VTRIVSVVLRPTKSWGGLTLLTATQKVVGGVCGPVGPVGTGAPTVCTVAVAVLFEVFVSGLFPLTLTVFVCAPTVLGVVTSVIVTDSPGVIVPMSQVKIAPPVQEPCELDAETNVFPAGIGSVTPTPVSALGPLLVTTIVHVMLPAPRV
jgi:hypothetical protein